MWRHLPSAISLKPGGYFLIVNEADGEDGSNEKWEKIIDMKTYTRKEIKEALFAAGFSDAGEHDGQRSFHRPGRADSGASALAAELSG